MSRGFRTTTWGLVLAAFVIATPLVMAAGSGEDAAYPRRTINYVIPFDPGGQSDVTAQYQKPYLEAALGVDVVIRHQPGAGGALAWTALTRQSGDGYTIYGNNIPHIIAQPLVREDAGYSTEQIKPVYLFQTTPIGLAVAPDAPFDTLAEFIAYAEANPGQITVSGSGTHSGHHLATLQLQELTGIELTYIPSTGAAPSVANFLGGHTMALMANSNDLVSHASEMKILAIGTEERFGPLPEVPTFIEQGTTMTAGIDRGVAVPPETPDEIIAVLEDAFEAVSSDPAFRAQMEELGFVTHTIGSEEFAAYIERRTREIESALRALGEI